MSAAAGETPAPQVGAAETLAREQRWRTWAVVAALLAALLPLAAEIATVIATSDVKQPNNSVSALLVADDNATAYLVSVIGQALGAIAIGATLLYLFAAVRGRRPEMPELARVAAIVAPVVFAAARIALHVYQAVDAGDFASKGTLLYSDAHRIVTSGTVTALTALGFFAQVALALAFVLIALNAMRVGLLTRFMGIVGIIVGVLFVIPLATPLPVVQAFWLAALALLFAGRWPSGMPPAWQTGRAEPWPTQQELRERTGDPPRATPRAGGGGLLGSLLAPRPQREPEPEAAPAEPRTGDPGRPPHPVSKKRKRKKRR